MFMGPLEATKPWSMEGVNRRPWFLGSRLADDGDRTGRAFRAERLRARRSPTPEQNRVLHKTIQGVTQDLDRMAFNTAISKMMEFTNYFLKCDIRPRSAMETLVLLLSPLTPPG